MKNLTTTGCTAVIAAVTAALLGSMLVSSPAEAAPVREASNSSQIRDAGSEAPQEFSAAQINEAIEEAKLGGYVDEQTVDADGNVRTTLDLGGGFVFDLVQAAPESRLSAGTDSKGTYVAFNSTDQNLIISGATYGIGAALCVVSGGTFCIIAGAVLTAATVAITSNGGVRCSGGKSLRVYPFAGGKVKPRCV